MSSEKPLPKTKLTNEEFVREMNLALQKLHDYRDTMKVVADNHGYWLEVDGELNRDYPFLLSAAYKTVFG